jgi:hypothetical protein
MLPVVRTDEEWQAVVLELAAPPEPTLDSLALTWFDAV